MYKMVLENEHAQGIISGLHEIAGVRDYDLWVLGVALLAVIVSGLAAYFAYRLNKKQSEILEQQNKIALFEKRYEIYFIINTLYLNISSDLKFLDYESPLNGLQLFNNITLFGNVIHKINSFSKYIHQVKFDIEIQKINGNRKQARQNFVDAVQPHLLFLEAQLSSGKFIFYDCNDDFDAIMNGVYHIWSAFQVQKIKENDTISLGKILQQIKSVLDKIEPQMFLCTTSPLPKKSSWTPLDITS